MKTKFSNRSWLALAIGALICLRPAVSLGQGIDYTNWNNLVTNWVQTSAPNENWYSMASSSDGTKLAAVVYGGGIYTSANAGVSWTQTGAPSNHWCYLASSADGTKLAACGWYDTVSGLTETFYPGGIYTSANSGGTWSLTSAPSQDYWTGLVSSSDGTKLAASTGPPRVFYTSANSGGTWSGSTPTYLFDGDVWEIIFTAITASTNGTLLAGCGEGNGIYTSANAGVSWTQTSAPNENWYALASSSDGTKLAAVVSGGGIYTSTNTGVSWTQTSAPSENWYAIASSSDGTKLAAVVYGGGIYTSTNTGVSWTQTGAPGENWVAVATSSDGTKLAATAYGGGIYTADATVSFILPAAIFSFVPTNGLAGTQVTIMGTNFEYVSAVLFNGATAAFTSISSNQITAIVPNNAISGPVSVSTPAGTAVSTNNFAITPPAIFSFAPTTVIAGTQVTITGANFAAVSAVLFNGVSAAYTVNSTSQITATVPTGATTGPISVTTLGGTAGSTNNFTFVYPPVLTGFSPASGIAGTTLTISGTNFATASSVTFNGLPASFTIASDHQISATAPAWAGSGPITVTNFAGAATTSSNFTYVQATQPVTLASPSGGGLADAVCNGSSNVTFSFSGTIGITASLIVSSDTTIDGSGQNVTISGNNSVGAFVVNPSVHLTLINLTIANGLATNGGGIYNNEGYVTVQNCTFSNNVARGSSGGGVGAGGGIFNSYGTVNLTGSTFVSNNATGGTGATGAPGASQGAPGGTGGSGGTGQGGALHNDQNAFLHSQMFITNCTFWGNSAVGGNGGAGGNGYNGYAYYNGYGYIYVYGGPGGQGGPAGYGYGGTMDNLGNLLAVNDTMAGGSAGGGNGGVGGYPGNYNESGYYNYGNGSNGSGFGGNVSEGNGSFFAISCLFLNTIVANPVSGGDFIGGAITDAGNNLSSDATLLFTNSTSFTNTNPDLGSLTNNGGPTWTMALLPGSPAIDAGQTIPGLTTDQRGLPRPSGYAFDMGAYEFQVVGVDHGLRAYDGTAIITLACEGPGSTNSALRFSKNGVNYGILLTATNSANASKFRIQTASGTKAFMILP